MGDSSTKADEDSFGFGFNDKDFSDRILRIEIIPKDSDDCVATEGDSLHVNSLILAAKSPFFYKLFKSGMTESQRKDVSLRISSSEKTAFMELLNFIYRNTLSVTKNSDLLDVLMVADKFEVASCTRYCIDLLLKMSISLEFALSVLELPSANLEVVQPLVDAVKKYLVQHYADLNKFEEEALKLPLAAVEIILGSEDLQVDTENDVFEFILKWGLEHYPKPNERRDIITKSLAKLIRFQYMSCTRLKKVLVHDEFKHEDVTKLVVEALFFKVENPYESPLGRHYNYPLIKGIKIENPNPHCIIFFDLKKEECENLFSSKRSIRSQSFVLGGRCVLLFAECKKKEEGSTEHFGLFVHLREGSETCGFEFAAMEKSTMKFVSQRREDSCIIDKYGRGFNDVFEMPWSTFMSDDNEYFIDDVLHLRVELTIVNPHV